MSTTPHKSKHRSSRFSSQSTLEMNFAFGRTLAHSVTMTETMHWRKSLHSGCEGYKASGWCGSAYLTLPGPGKSGLCYHLPLANQPGVNPTIALCSTLRYPVITSPHFQLRQAGFRPNRTTRKIITEAEKIVTPFAVNIKKLAEMKGEMIVTASLVCVLCVVYMCVGAGQGVWTALTLIILVVTAAVCLIAVVNTRLRNAYRELSSALEVFSESQGHLLLQGYSVSSLGPFALHITLVSRGTLPHTPDRTNL